MRAPWIIAAGLAAALLAAAPATAQEVITGQPLIGLSATDSQNGSTGNADEVSTAFRILVIGDALGGGLGAGLMRLVEGDAGYDVTLRYVEESGIARPEVYDWGETLPRLFDGNSFDAVVVLLGANDRQQIRSGDLRLAFGTADWATAYKAQTDRILDALTAGGAVVYWVSLPPMADPDYEKSMETVLALQKERVEAKGARFVDIRKAFLASDGSYTDQGPDDTGTVRKLRGRDGVSFFKQGNNRLAQLVLAAIKANAGAAPKSDLPATSEVLPKVQTAAIPRQVTTPPPPEIILPLFGQVALDGGEASFRPDSLAAMGMARAGPVAAGVVALQSMAPPGSAAEKLFVSGEMAPAPAGRVDDFSLPVQK
ncbi:MAG: DUF459 domain-containing protein [Rhizobiales bacterium]|nr:DUF459 domain-containing protein [Hyphomicrobiales bacterium]MBI3672385.1 DUF459 domain-containing protein [Hyphomicrobiales bacterium]